MDLLEKGATWLAQQRTRHLARPVRYERGGMSVELSATIGRSEVEQVDEFGIVQRLESRDFLILAGDLVLGGQPTLPQPGDRIVETDGGQTLAYEVLAPGQEPPWRYSNPYRRTLRVHTKFVGAVG